MSPTTSVSVSASSTSATLAHIAVIGGGSVTVAFLHHLLEALAGTPAAAREGVVVTVLEPRERIGRGSAYHDDLETNLLNVTVAGMSAAADDKAHFKRWLAAQGITHFRDEPIRDASFVSRPLFGRYLEAVWDATTERARALGVPLQHVRQPAVAVQQAGADSYRLTLGDGTQFNARHVVLSLGNLDSPAFAECHGQPGYFASPYPTQALAGKIAPDAHVCVLGTSLSAVDAILGLVASGHRGPITAVSRQGRLPCVRSEHPTAATLSPAFRAQLQQAKTEGRTLPLDTLMAQLHEELQAAQASAPAGVVIESLATLAAAPPPAEQFLAEEIALARSQPRPWQAVGNMLNEVVDLLWHLLSPADRQRFDREYRTLWMSRRVSFPLENALALQALMQQGQLTVAGGFQSVQPADSGAGFRITQQSAEGEPASTWQADAVINATSFSTDAARSTMPLLRHLLADGLARPDPFGGLQADFDTGCLLTGSGQLQPHFTALGSMVAGTYFWTNAMEVNARLAMGQARRLAAMFS